MAFDGFAMNVHLRIGSSATRDGTPDGANVDRNLMSRSGPWRWIGRLQ